MPGFTADISRNSTDLAGTLNYTFEKLASEHHAHVHGAGYTLYDLIRLGDIIGALVTIVSPGRAVPKT